MFYSDLSISVSIEIKRNLKYNFYTESNSFICAKRWADMYLALLKHLFHFLNRFMAHLFAWTVGYK